MSLVTAIEHKPNNAFVLTVTVPWSQVEEEYNKVVEQWGREVEIKGFRKGKAPLEMLKKKLDKTKVYAETAKRLLARVYQQAVGQENLSPITAPKTEVVSAEPNKDWQFRFTSCQKPEVVLGKYKEKIRKALATDKIWVPGEGKSPKQTKDANPAEKRRKQLAQVLKILLDTCRVKLAEVMIENETDRSLSALISRLESTRVPLEHYLAALGKSAQELRASYKKQVEEDFALEFILEKIADEMEVRVEDKELTQAIESIKDEKLRKQYNENAAKRYYLSYSLRRNKTLDKLLSL